LRTERQGGLISNDNDLIEQYITDEATADSRKRNEPVLTRTGTPVWVVAGYCLRACDGSIELAAKDYELTEDEVRAALVYIRDFQWLHRW
jgi:hypothetical protein